MAAGVLPPPGVSSVRGVQDGAGRGNNGVPYFEEFNVDLMMESHDHALKPRTAAPAPTTTGAIIHWTQ